MREIIQDPINSKSAIRNPQSEIRNPKFSPVSRYDQKLEFILRNASRIFAEKGYHSTTMRDISRATGISLAGLYHYCKSKEELLFLIQDNCFGRVLERLKERLRETESAVGRLRVFIENHLSFFAANMAEMKVLSHEEESLAGDKHQQVANKKREYTKRVRQILAQLQDTKEGKQKVDLTVATYALFGMLNWIYNWYDPKGNLKVNDLAENVTRLFLGGFSSGDVSTDLPSTVSHKTENISVWRAGQVKKT
ncbi:MAG TPA: TetR/AcrR family transcriptional regulator [Pyrinomonadaceae bacterium]|nr:TetR/AcrR family transcriptional regulator [Pyrinomonadaceae bacterium]